MLLLFRSISDLLQTLEDNAANTKKALDGWLDQRNKDVIESWVKSHKITLNSASVDVVAVLSALFPDKRTDRVYSLKPRSLSKILGRCFRLGTTRIKQLEEWKVAGRGDLGSCVERTLRETEHQEVTNPVTLDQVDSTLLAIAAKNRFSAPGIRDAAADDGVEKCKRLESIYLRLSSNEAKWFTRMILKDYSTLTFKSYYLLNAIDSRLKQALDVHSTFEAAVGLLRHQDSTNEGHQPSRTPLMPLIGSKIGKVPFLKGRSIKNVVQLVGSRKMSVERKYDGEYCQIHVNLARGRDCIQIFSKSGKDSTADRQGVHETIKHSLRIGHPDCKFTRQCILEGELLVYNDLEQRVADFHKIRKHVTRSGSFLGTELDSQHEHLMISYYDVMLIDENVIMDEPHTNRRRLLKELVVCIPGKANLSKQKEVDFAKSSGPEKLRELFSQAITHRWEGLVLKPSDAPYCNLLHNANNSTARCWIKLKKDYIPGLGDTADFFVIGAGYNATKAAQLREPSLEWTHFHIGCLRNKKEVNEKKARPYIVVVFTLEVNRRMAKYLNQHGQFCASQLIGPLSYQEPFVLDIRTTNVKMTVVFQKPFVLDVMGAGFDKEPNRDFYTLRFPRALKIHSDRDWKACVGFDELQEMARVAKEVPSDTKAEVAEWRKRLELVDRGAKGLSVPWDLSDDDIETPQEVASGKLAVQSSSQRNRRQSSVAPPMIRMDTAEMTDKEQRLESGEVVRKPAFRSPISNWSDSNLPTPPKSSPCPETAAQHSSRVLSSMQSTNSTDQGRKRSSDDTECSSAGLPSKRARASPPVKRTKKAASISAEIQHTANSKTEYIIQASGPVLRKRRSANPTPQHQDCPAQKSFLVPKLLVGTAEALRSNSTKATDIRGIRQSSEDRQTTQESKRTEEAEAMSTQHSTSQALAAEWELPDPIPTPLSRYPLPDLFNTPMVLGPDVSGMPYLTRDILGANGIRTHLSADVFVDSNHRINLPEVPDSRNGSPQDVIFLIEGRCHDTSLEMLKYIIGRVPEDGSQVIWVFDWHLVESYIARGKRDEVKLLGDRLMARYWYEDGEMKWFSNMELVHIMPKESVKTSREMGGAFLGRGGRMVGSQ
ncbi:MAG: hypothetical protein Q9218_005977 [Villophora microphyllina]